MGALIAATAVISGCMGDDADKAGGEGESDAVVLTLANPDDGAFNLDEFAREVESQSDGSMRIEFENNWRLGEVNKRALGKSGRLDLNQRPSGPEPTGRV